MAPDLLAHTAELVAVPSVSREEAPLVDLLQRALDAVPGLEVTRCGDNLVARTDLGRSIRVILAGHTDTVPPNGNDEARVIGDRLYGLGASDMKGGLAVMLEAARTITDPCVDVTYVFYAREEIAATESGLLELFREVPHLLDGDVALLGEPTSGAIEAGCQGTMRVRVVLRGARAHAARPWMGRNAIHRAGALLQALATHEARQPVIQGCHYREAVQAVNIRGGVAGNVIPDEVEVLVNHRFAPDRDGSAAERWLRSFLAPFVDEDGGDVVEVLDLAESAAPALDHPVVAELVRRHQLAVRAKLGWTDVARFTARGIPAVNFGPGDAELAHTKDEFVTAEQLAGVWAALRDLLVDGVPRP